LGVVAIGAAGAALAAEEGYYAQPALHGDRLVFASEGDLWTATLGAAPAGPLVAHRLTSADGDEAWPRFSPDGRLLAFSGAYDGNVDVYVMPAEGGAPRRLTFHPDAETVLGFSPDGKDVLFRSGARHPLGRAELWRVPAAGGSASRYDFGECSYASLHPDGARIAFTRWSNESWSWKRYRGGTAPDVWVGDLRQGTFSRLTQTDANELFPTWVGDRVLFLSDRTGTANLWVDDGKGGAPKAVTTFAPKEGDPTAIEGYDVRWPSADAAGGPRVAFCQAGALALVDLASGATTRLDVRLASDRKAARDRFADPADTATEYALSADGKAILLGSRGEVVRLPVEGGLPPVQVTRSSGAREWGASALGSDRLAMISDAGGEQAVVTLRADGEGATSPLEAGPRDAPGQWLFPPEASPDGAWVAYGDKSLRLHLVETGGVVDAGGEPSARRRRVVETSSAGEIRDYRFSPDGRFLAYVLPLDNGYGAIRLHEVETGETFSASGPLHDDFAPRWDPAGKYLYFLSRRHLDPVIGDLDFEHVLLGTVEVFALPLEKATPPPSLPLARAAGFDLEAWGKPARGGKGRGGRGGGEDGEGKDGEKAADEGKDGKDGREGKDGEKPKEPPPKVTIDRDGLADRATVLPIEAGEIRALEAIRGGVLWLASPRRGLLREDGPGRGERAFGDGSATLRRRLLAKEEKAESVLASNIRGFVTSGDGKTVAWAAKGALRVLDASAGPDDAKEVSLKDVRLRVATRLEWEQILREAWRLQRDFYWADTLCGCDWEAMLRKYEALLPRVGTRAELNDLIGQMLGELGTSHTYVSGGATFDPPTSVSVGLLGADLEREGDVVRIRRVVPGQPWDDDLVSPLAQPHLGVAEGTVLLAIDGVPLGPDRDPYELLQDKAGKPVRLRLASDAAGKDGRTVTVTTVRSERGLRYAEWVEANRRRVDERSRGALGYVHVPNMMGRGLVAFDRLFYPQVNKKGLVVDVRNNGGGFVSQMIVRRLDREVWAFMQPRHGAPSRYPEKALYGHRAVLIDQHAGSDGDIFPASFRLRGLGPLIGTRTWGGVVGIRSDKPFVDMGMSTQPEFAWWSPKDGWSVENRGVSPDIEVDVTPADRRAGRDPQLDRAIDWLLEKLASDPKELPKPPPFPVR
jgi:tricorn protease